MAKKDVVEVKISPAKTVTPLSKSSVIGDMVSFVMNSGEKLQGELLNFVGDVGAMVLLPGGKTQAVKV